MKKRKLLYASILMISPLFLRSQGQVGLNVATPKATLDVDVTNIPNVPEGFAPPRLTGDQLIIRDNLYTVEQQGGIVYVTEVPRTSTPKTINIDEPGYYYFDGEVWQTFKGSTDILNTYATQLIIPPYGFNIQAGRPYADFNNHTVSIYDTNDWWLISKTSAQPNNNPFTLRRMTVVYEYQGPPFDLNNLFPQLMAVQADEEGAVPSFTANIVNIVNTAEGKTRLTVNLNRIDRQLNFTQVSRLNVLLINTRAVIN